MPANTASRTLRENGVGANMSDSRDLQQRLLNKISRIEKQMPEVTSLMGDKEIATSEVIKNLAEAAMSLSMIEPMESTE